MNLNHIHLGVRDLRATLDWLDRVWQLKPQFQNDRMATIQFGSFILILDAAEADSPATIGFESDDCDRDFRTVVERGAALSQNWSAARLIVAAAFRPRTGGNAYYLTRYTRLAPPRAAADLLLVRHW
jgi:catechol 2,3-dioxygenase-like lactoylglutathione lyase family enzyme